MKKIFLVLAAALCVATVSAKNKFESSVKQAAQTIASQKWSAGLRVGSGLQADAECFYAGDKYVEARLGLGWIDGIGADFTVLHNWNCFNWDWTPSVGQWFFDAGVGANLGGNRHGLSVGVAGQAKFGIKFNKVPIRLAIDVTPSIGIWHAYGQKVVVEYPLFDDAGQQVGVETQTYRSKSHTGFYSSGLLNFGISATYCF